MEIKINFKYEASAARDRVTPDVGVCFPTDDTEVFLCGQVVVLLRVGASRRLEEEPHDEGVFTLQLCVTNSKILLNNSFIVNISLY